MDGYATESLVPNGNDHAMLMKHAQQCIFIDYVPCKPLGLPHSSDSTLCRPATSLRDAALLT